MGYLASNLVQLLVFVVWLLVLGRVVSSWVDPMGRNRWSRTLIDLTEPFLAPIRRVIPPVGPLDLSPLIVLIVLGILVRIVG